MVELPCSNYDCKNQAKTFAGLLSRNNALTELAFCKDHIGKLGMDYLLPNPTAFEGHTIGTIYEECGLNAVLFQYEPEAFTIILRSKDSPSVLVVPTGYLEASMIFNYAKKVACKEMNPATHELILSIIQALGGSPCEAVLYGYDKITNAYLGYLAIASTSGLVKVSCRVSDMVAIALISNIHIKINTCFLGRDLATG